ncbi:pyrroline-5-carboxylate reductase [Eisenibacter elegans]|jgi:pyrroline-5-carboxylate reductase|uniref:pyrroline-5-carboxylate reductase n=1 Tax=Eisenibacter elegans TaxID=997 RepID=UPI000422C6A4|nr:pyrroline-5-carboxylate reductase [Eisenibacter elegans]
MEILIAGVGSMGKTYADSFLQSQAITKDDLLLLEHSDEKADMLRQAGFPHVIQQADASVSAVRLLILAVKPQDTASLYAQLRPWLKPEQLVLSIMAGVQLFTLQQALGISKIIRAMPNLPAQIGMGMTAFTADASVSRQELLYVHNLLNTTGKSLYFDEEHKLDAVTAISGSGPAYVYYFMDAMMQAAKQMGFSHTEAELLVTQTFMGAVHLENRSSLSCQEWIGRVASKGGTTEAALKSFEADALRQSIIEGLEEARKRAQVLGGIIPKG